MLFRTRSNVLFKWDCYKKKQNTPGGCLSLTGRVLFFSELQTGGNWKMTVYAAFAGAKTSAFFRRACIERTMQLSVKLMTK